MKLSELRTCDITGLSLFDDKSDEAVIVTIERVKMDKPVMDEVLLTLLHLDSLEGAEATVRDPHVCKTKDRTIAIIREDQMHQPLITIVNETNGRKRQRN